VLRKKKIAFKVKKMVGRGHDKKVVVSHVAIPKFRVVVQEKVEELK